MFNNIKSKFIRLIAPITPHLAEELWEINNNQKSVFLEPYPKFDPSLCVQDQITIAIQVNGKLRGSLKVDKDINKIIKLSL